MIKSNRNSDFKTKPEISVVPLLDVLLVLLLIFIATAPVITQNVEVNLPNMSKLENMGTNNNNSLVIIEISGIGKYNILVDNNRINQLLPEQIISNIQHRMKLNQKTVFLIGGAKDVPYNEVIKVLNLLHIAGVRSVGLMTESI